MYLFLTQVLAVSTLFNVGTSLKKKQKSHAYSDAKKRGILTKRQYLYSPYLHTHNPYLSTFRRNPYTRPFFFFKTNAQRRQSLPNNRATYNSFLSNPFHYEAKLNNHPFAYETMNRRVDNDGETKSHSPFVKKIFGKGIPLQNGPVNIVKTKVSLDEPSASGDEKSEGGVLKQGSFKIDDGPVKGFGTYQIMADKVDVDISIKIKNSEESTGGETEGGGSGEAKTTPKPGAGESKPTPSGGGEGNKAEKATEKPGAGETTPSPGGEEASGEEEEEDVAAFEQEALKAHNDFRARHGAPAMTLNKELSKEAAEWAKHLGTENKFEHSPSDKRKNQGENIAGWCDAKGETATQATNRWYEEVCDPGYDFSRNDMDWGAGHFTQVVWKKSTELGIGFYDKKRDDGWVCRTIVARYREPGNGGGTFLENVKKGSFNKSNDCHKKSK